MAGENFPLDCYLSTLARLMDTVSYHDENYSREKRVAHLRYAHSKAAAHFAQPDIRDTMKISQARVNSSLLTISSMVVYAWSQASPQVQADLTILYTYTLLLDDYDEGPDDTMESWYLNLLQGKQQEHWWWRLVNNFLPTILSHYGGYCGLNIVRSLIDFFEGCWIEQSNFKGYYGSHEYPDFLRRLNGLGHCVGSTLWPAEQFDETAAFKDITSAIAQLEHWMVWVNDLFSFYKEFNAERDQVSLITTFCQTEGITINEALEKLCHASLQSTEQIVTVFKNRDAKIWNNIQCFLHGYITWHLCDSRYRLFELFQIAENDDIGVKFRMYFKAARRVGGVDISDYVPNCE